MSSPHPYTLSKFFSSLLGKDVAFALGPNAVASKAPQMLGEYRVEPDGSVCVVSVDLSVLAHFGAALLGLPGDAAMQRCLETPMDEPLRDAIHEVLNIAASGIATTHRLVFTGMHRDAVYLSSRAADTMGRPLQITRYDVKLDGHDIGCFAIYSC